MPPDEGRARRWGRGDDGQSEQARGYFLDSEESGAARRGKLTLADARAEAARLTAEIKQIRREGTGDHPLQRKNQFRAERAAAKQAALLRPTVKQFFDREFKPRYLAEHRKDGGKECERTFKLDLFPVIGNVAIEDVRRRDIVRVLDAMRERGATRQVNICLAYLKSMFKFAVRRDVLETDPTAALDKSDAGGSELVRTRVLSADEIRELAFRLSVAPRNVCAGLWLLLATAARVNELQRAQWSDVDLEQATWTIPAENSKNGFGHVVQLSNFAITWFQALLLEAKPGQDPKKGFVLRGRGCSHVDRWYLTRYVGREQARGGGSAGRALLELPGGGWTPHDLRRTASTIMGELDVQPEVIDRCLNHRPTSKQERTYQQQELVAGRRRAFDLLGDWLDRAVRGELPKVLPFRHAA